MRTVLRPISESGAVLDEVSPTSWEDLALMYTITESGKCCGQKQESNADGEIEETGRVVRFRGNIGQAFMYGIESLFELNTLSLFGVDQRDFRLKIFANTAITQSEYLDSEIPGVEGNEVEFVPALNMKTGAFLSDIKTLSVLCSTPTCRVSIPTPRTRSKC